MSTRNFRKLLENQWAQGKHLCVGLESDYVQIVGRTNPTCVDHIRRVISDFNRKIVEATKDFAAAYKPNLAFYLARGAEGFEALRDTIFEINIQAPNVPVILDAKFGDIGNTSEAYARCAFEKLYADAVTVNPYLGRDALQPFLNYKERGIFVLCRTSNPGAAEFQNVEFMLNTELENLKIYEYVGLRVTHEWNTNGNCGLVVGATAPSELEDVRKLAPDLPILIPGVGAQGGDLEASVKAAKHRFLINSSRGIIFSKDPRAEAEKLHNAITQALKGG